jgi:hypothetical protein
MGADGRSVITGDRQYISSGVATGSMGKKIGKGSYNDTPFSVYEEAGKDPGQYIIVMFDTEMQVAEEYVNPFPSVNHK